MARLLGVRIRANVLPKKFVDSALDQGKTGFAESFGGVHLLLVQCGDMNSDVVLDPLEEQSRRMARRRHIFGPARSSSNDTEPGITIKPRARDTQKSRLVTQLSEAPHLVVPLKKQERSGPKYPDRITVGRALDQDVILQEASVSKAQAWFEMDAEGHYYLWDARSRNGTYVNYRRLSPRERMRVAPGDAISFAHVDAILCTPEALWDALHVE